MLANPPSTVLPIRTMERVVAQDAAERRQYLRGLVVVHREVEILRIEIARPHQRHVVTRPRRSEVERALPLLGVVRSATRARLPVDRPHRLGHIELGEPLVHPRISRLVRSDLHRLGLQCLGRLIQRDQLRGEARAALAAMRALGVERMVLLTGDRAAAAREVGTALGMDQVIAEVLPAQKLEVVRAEQAAGHVVMMVGDGVNDALALGGSDVGVAIGAELNEVALGGADVAVLGTDLGRVPRLIGLADITRRIIGQNVWLAFGLSVILIVGATMGIVAPLTGALAQSAAVLAVVANSARILRFTSGPRS